MQAIETLLDRPAPNPCPTCNRDMGPGPTRLFRDFVETHCLTGAVEQKAASALYSVRSSLAHGRYLFQIDEAPWSINLGAIIASDHEIDVARSALLIAKEGLRNWTASPGLTECSVRRCATSTAWPLIVSGKQTPERAWARKGALFFCPRQLSKRRL